MSTSLQSPSLSEKEKSSESEFRNRYSNDDPDKLGVETTISSVDGDEALRLVGRERTAQFSEEYNKKLRRKLVSIWYYALETSN